MLICGKAGSIKNKIKKMSSIAQKREIYEEWLKTDTKEGLVTAVLRLGWTKSEREVPEFKEKGHWVDVELACDVIAKMPGPKPSFEYLLVIAEALRDNENWRPISSPRNNHIERDTAALVAENQPVTLQGHQLNKAQKQAEWLVKHKNTLPPGFVAKMGEMLANVKDEDTGKTVMDQRRLKGAGSDFKPDAKSDAALQRDIDAMTAKVATMEISDEKKAILAPLVASGAIKFTKDGAIDKRSTAVKRGDVIVTESGDLDGRSAVVRAAAAAISAATTPVSSPVAAPARSAPAAPTAAPITDGLRYKADGTLDMRQAAVRSGAVLVTNSGHVDGRSAIVRAGGYGGSSSSSSSSSSGGGGYSAGPCKADGTPDMRYAANRR